MIKKIIRTILVIICALAGILLIFGLLFKYEMSWKITTVGAEKDPDGRYSAVFQKVGEADWPFGYSHAKVIVKDGDRIVESFREDIADDGAQFRPANYSVEWMKYGVVITFMGSEQPDREVEVFYDGESSFTGYTDEEIAEILGKRYSVYRVEEVKRDNDGYAITADGISFRADKSLAFHDSYPQEAFKSATEEVFPEKITRSVDWEVTEGENPSKLVYTPVISMNKPRSNDIDAYCEDICKWLDSCFERLLYIRGKRMYDAAGFIVAAEGYQNVRFGFNNMLRLERYSEDRDEFYDNLHTCLERYLNDEYWGQEAGTTGYGHGDASEGTYGIGAGNDYISADIENSPLEVTEEAIRQWATYDYSVYYDFPDGREFALVPVDRALGSSFYVLLCYNTKGNPESAELVNADPFNQQGGEAKFITFPDDGTTGFAALTYAGGSEGLLFETRDGGKSFVEVTLPSPEIELSNGEKYNPFIMPEEAWEEDGVIYLKISQGPDGDYHNKELDDARTVAIYASFDKGETFEFVREEAE